MRCKQRMTTSEMILFGDAFCAACMKKIDHKPQAGKEVTLRTVCVLCVLVWSSVQVYKVRRFLGDTRTQSRSNSSDKRAHNRTDSESERKSSTFSHVLSLPEKREPANPKTSHQLSRPSHHVSSCKPAETKSAHPPG